MILFFRLTLIYRSLDVSVLFHDLLALQSSYEHLKRGKKLAVYENAMLEENENKQDENSYEELKDKNTKIQHIRITHKQS